MKRIFGMAVAVAILGGSLHAMKPEKKKEASTNNASTGEEKKKGVHIIGQSTQRFWRKI